MSSLSQYRLADSIKGKSTLLKQTSPLPVYKIPLKEEQISVAGCRHYSFGKESTKHNRTIMVLGATGSGKSTLINGMINYILGIEWEDSYRFKLVDEGQSRSQTESQTDEVTVYKINHQEGFKIEYSLTIVDTPGYGDTRGIDRDKEITEQLRNLFSADLGVSEIDAVCFVAQASSARLTPSQKYVFDSVLSIFGKDVAENIRVLVTFADSQRPPVLEGISASGVPCPKTDDGLPVYFKFNNSALFADNKSAAAAGDSMSEDEEDGGFDQMFWNMGKGNMKRFFAALNIMQTKSLTMTKEVLRESEQLQNSVENLEKQVKVGLAKLEEINETTEKLKQHEAEINRNENFEFEVTVKKPVQIDISGTGNYITNCQQCHYTCHYPCREAGDDYKRRCTAMGQNAYCTVCPGKCYWNVHSNQKYKWEYTEFKEKRTVEELKEKYLEAAEAKRPVQALIEKLMAEYDEVQAEVVKLMEGSTKSLNRLKEITLKPNRLFTPEYIDMIIEKEKSEAKSGWKQRIQFLKAMREKAEYMTKGGRGEKASHNTSETNTNRDHDQINTNADQNKAETDTNQAKTKSNCDINQYLTESDTNQSQDETKTDLNMNKDQASELDTTLDQDQDKSGSDANQGQDSELDTNLDQVKTTSDADKGQDSELYCSPDQVKTTSGSDKGQDSDLDTNLDQVKTTSDADKGQDSELYCSPDQVKTTSDADKGQERELDTNPDQDKTGSETNKEQDRAQSASQQD